MLDRVHWTTLADISPVISHIECICSEFQWLVNDAGTSFEESQRIERYLKRINDGAVALRKMHEYYEAHKVNPA